MFWIQVFIWSVLGCYPFYIVGTVVCCLVWYFCRRWRGVPRIVIRSLFVSLLVSPGILGGHGGFASVPAVAALWYEAVDRHRAEPALYDLRTIGIVWVGSAILL